MRTVRFGSGKVQISVVALLTLGLVTTIAPSAGASSLAGGELTSRIKAGYVDGGGPVHAMTAGWVQPEVECGAAPTSVSSQIGVGQRFAGQAIGTAADCRDGRATYYAWSGSERSRWSAPVRPGDHIRFTIRVHPRELSYQIVNRTQGWGFGVGQEDGWPNRRLHRAWFLIKTLTLRDGRTLPLADFGRVRLHVCRVNNEPLDGAVATRIEMVDRQGRSVAKPSVTRPLGGFTVTRLP